VAAVSAETKRIDKTKYNNLTKIGNTATGIAGPESSTVDNATLGCRNSSEEQSRRGTEIATAEI
jgi:hypothetical protein